MQDSVENISNVKASFSFRKIIPKITQIYILYTNLSFYITFTIFIILDKDNFVKEKEAFNVEVGILTT